MTFAGVVPASLVDYPGHLATTLFVAGCNLRCGYCHNPGLVAGPPAAGLDAEAVLASLERRARLIRHVCVSGGEATLHRDLVPFLEELVARGFTVKLDTNGARPRVLETILARGLCAYVAMDVKTAWERYGEIGAPDPDPYRRSSELIRAAALDYEFRTTAVPGLVEDPDVRAIAAALCGARRYALQQFVPSGPLLDPAWTNVAPHPAERLRAWARDLDGCFQEPVQVRNA